ncbi:hypothetical protein Hdeb2414_s0040g00736361 [Helianthus debilis subsp. tardiflorus]
MPPPNPRLTSTFVTAPPRQTTFNTAARPSETLDHSDDDDLRIHWSLMLASGVLLLWITCLLCLGKSSRSLKVLNSLISLLVRNIWLLIAAMNRAIPETPMMHFEEGGVLHGKKVYLFSCTERK